MAERTLEERTAILEEGQIALTKDINQLAITIKEMSTSLSNAITKDREAHTQHINALREEVQNYGKPDWQVIGIFLGLIITIIGVILVPIWMTTSRNQEEYSTRIDTLKEYVQHVDTNQTEFEKYYYQTQNKRLENEIHQLEQDKDRRHTSF